MARSGLMAGRGTTNVASRVEELRAMSESEIREELRLAFAEHGNMIKRMAEIVGVCEERGIDVMDFFPVSVYEACKRINAGTMLADIWNMGLAPAVYRKVSMLPVDEQKKIADGKGVKVATGVLGSGKVDYREVNVTEIDNSDLHIVFAAGRVRTPEEQLRLKNRKQESRRGQGTFVNVPMDAKMHAKVERAAKKANMSVSDYILRIISDHFNM